MNNEPVAWIEEDGMVRFDVRWASQMQGKEPIPLYTHPAELTDEEIFATALEQYGHSVGLYGNHIGFARAILRKAQE